MSVDNSSLVADPIDIIDRMPVQANTVRPIWLSIHVPANISAGIYIGGIIINADQGHELKISLNVLDHVLPPPSEWSYDLDIWQYPAPIARIHDVGLWSEEHSVLIQRKKEGKPTTFYTACNEKYPTGYTFSPPAENVFLGWHTAAKGFTGYLFWAFNTWVPNPLQDARWRRYPSGTLFQFYPGSRTSIRFEKLIEGI